MPKTPKPLTLRQVEQLARENAAGDAWDALTPSQRRQWAARVQKQVDRERRDREAEQRRREKANDRFFEALSAPVLLEMAQREAAAKRARRKKR